MALPISLHPEAVNEARAAREWYEERNPAAADAFVLELDHAIDQIAQFPEGRPPYLHGTRRFLLRRYPFSIIYRKSGAGVAVLAFAAVFKVAYYP